MTQRISRIFTLTLLAAVSAIAGDDAKCHASARECDQQIRQMLSGRRYLGVTVEDRHPGLFVQAVAAGSPAARAGLRTDDRLIALNGKTLIPASIRDFKQMIYDARDSGTLRMIVARSGSYVRINARLEPYSKEQIDKIVSLHLSQSHPSSAGAQR